MNTRTHTSGRAARAFLVAAAAGALALPAARAQTPEEFKQLKALVENLQKTVEAQDARIKELEGTKAAAPAPTSAAATSPSQKTIDAVAAGQDVGQASPVAYRGALNDQQEAASRPLNFTLDPKYQGFIPVPNTPALIKLNAKPHLDVITDNKNAGNNNRFVPALFPLEGSPEYGGGSRTTMTANATQIRVDVRAPEMDGNFRFYYQNDFFGSGSDSGDMKYRVQHLYGQYYGFKGGFTYGVWEDPDSWPDTVDYEGPNAVIFSRRPVAQYTQVLNDKWNATYGVEKADIYVDVLSGPNAGGAQLTRMPDVGMNVRYEEAGFGHLQFSAMLRDLGARDSAGDEHHVAGFGVNASATLDLGDNNTVQFLGVVGEGVGGMGNDTSFLNSDAAFNADGELEALPYWSLHFGVTHRWSKTARSTFTYGYVNLDNTDGQEETFYHTSTYASANIVWQIRKRLSLGLETLYGTKEARNGVDSGDHLRIQLGMVYSLFD
jgi:hypothetical protein